MSVLVFAESSDKSINKGAYETVFYGKEIASKLGTDVTVVTYGNVDDGALADLGAFGADKVLINRNITQIDDELLTGLVEKAAEKENSAVVVFGFDVVGKSVAPRLSARMKAGLVPGAVAVPEIDGDTFKVKKAVFSGKAFATYTINSDKKIISLLPNSLQPTKEEKTATVEEFVPDLDPGRLTIKEKIAAGGDGIPLPEADLVVSAGRGLKGPENWGIVEELAETLGAATACSRPVADIGWRPHHEHVGQTGIAIRPNLYIAAGISGAIQHLAGVNGSKTIVVINTDPEAPFFKAADYGINGDAFEVLPRLTEAVKKFKADN